MNSDFPQQSDSAIEDIENTDFVGQQQRNAQLDNYREMQKRKYEARSASRNIIEPIAAPVVEEEKENAIMHDKYDNANNEESKRQQHPWENKNSLFTTVAEQKSE